MLRKTAHGLVDALRQRVTDVWPTCDLCGEALDKIELAERAGPTAVRVLGTHHGCEELATFELGTEHWDPTDVHRAMRGHRWFRPEARTDDERTPLDVDSIAKGVAE